MRMWGIGKRRYRKDWRKRVDKLVWTVVGYGMETWGRRKGKRWKN